ncbi:MAG: CHASE2 domain-containing protein, partial [Gammaproteobacteria bacterium]|nr:CHASE2 domain-containing protein [Gammaproteobacteria bacterium]
MKKIFQTLRKYRKQLFIISISLFMTMAFLGYSRGTVEWTFMEQFENKLYDLKVVLTLPEEIDDRIVIVDIDEKSLAEVERWPWSRDKLALLVNKLFDNYFVAIVGFDIYFREADDSSGLKVLETLANEEFSEIPEYRSRLSDISEQLDYDQLFVDSMMKGPVVLGFTFFTEGEAFSDLRGGDLPMPVLTAEDFANRNVHAPVASGYGVNLPMIQQAAIATG